MLIFSILFMIGEVHVFSETVSALEIMKKMEQNLRGNSSFGTVSMEIVTPNWQRQIDIDFYLSGTDNAMVKITAPPKEAGISTLRVGNVIWQYMPGVERTIKIPLSMMMQPWMGSNFTYDDMMKATTLVNDYQHKLIGAEILDGEKIWKIESVPNPGVPVVWGKQVFFVGSDYLPRREEFYDEKGRLVKVLEFSGFQQMGERMFPSKWKMIDRNKKGHFTLLKYKSLKFDVPIKPDMFSLRSVKR